jgi:hypothetical protein
MHRIISRSEESVSEGCCLMSVLTAAADPAHMTKVPCQQSSLCVHVCERQVNATRVVSVRSLVYLFL